MAKSIVSFDVRGSGMDTTVVQTWADGTIREFALGALPDKSLYYFAALGAKERLGNGGVLAGKTHLGISKLIALVDDVWKDALDGIVNQRSRSTNLPDLDTYREAIRTMKPDVTEESLEAHIKARHPDAAVEKKERTKRRRWLKERVEASDNLRAALIAVGWTPPAKPCLDEELERELDA